MEDSIDHPCVPTEYQQMKRHPKKETHFVACQEDESTPIMKAFWGQFDEPILAFQDTVRILEEFFHLGRFVIVLGRHAGTLLNRTLLALLWVYSTTDQSKMIAAVVRKVLWWYSGGSAFCSSCGWCFRVDGMRLMMTGDFSY